MTSPPHPPEPRAPDAIAIGLDLLRAGRPADAAALFRQVLDKALALNPLAPDLYYWASASVDYFLGDYASASATAGHMKNRGPAARFIAAVEAMNGNLDEAARHRDIYLAEHPDFRLADYLFPFKPREHCDAETMARRSGHDDLLESVRALLPLITRRAERGES